ncbi:MAG: acylphosphatase [Gaiellales bacterium]|nr:MAG: acylphosphatase [Gaiellales bacterium]
MTKRVHLYISGRVQGVFFRGWVAEQARKLGLAGWVRNRFNGGVEAVIEGPDEAVDEMVRLCHDGPPHARVDSVLDNDTEPVMGLSGFRIRGSV